MLVGLFMNIHYTYIIQQIQKDGYVNKSNRKKDLYEFQFRFEKVTDDSSDDFFHWQRRRQIWSFKTTSVYVSLTMPGRSAYLGSAMANIRKKLCSWFSLLQKKALFFLFAVFKIDSFCIAIEIIANSIIGHIQFTMNYRSNSKETDLHIYWGWAIEHMAYHTTTAVDTPCTIILLVETQGWWVTTDVTGQGWVRNIRHVTYMVFDTSKTT